jgi:hypothetical protein
MEDLARQTAENARRFQHLDRKLIMHDSSGKDSASATLDGEEYGAIRGEVRLAEASASRIHGSFRADVDSFVDPSDTRLLEGSFEGELTVICVSYVADDTAQASSGTIAPGSLTPSGVVCADGRVLEH